jgi:hypothetical protein
VKKALNFYFMEETWRYTAVSATNFAETKTDKMENKNNEFDESELSEFAQKILAGMRRAIRKLVEESAA